MENTKHDYTREELMAVRKLDNLYSLKQDNELAIMKLNDFNKRNSCILGRIKIESKNKHFQTPIAKYFCDILDAIENGTLVFVDKK